MRKLPTFSSCLAALAIVSAGGAHAACGGGGNHAPAKSPAVTETATISAPAVLYGSSLDSTRFDTMSSRLNLSTGQSKEISNAKSEINDENEKLTKAQMRAQSKLENCDGNCANERRNLASTTDALKNYNTNKEFELRLHSILRDSQAVTYFRD